jgi:coenzyme F420-0:L-glutamate ligase/coenzyme F420-1:gamma-L-glutamate ligase
MKKLELTALDDFPDIQAGDDLGALICLHAAKNGLSILNDDIIVIAQKVVSKSEDRYVNLSTVDPSPRALALSRSIEKDPRFVELVLQESKEVLRTRPGTIIVEHNLGFICANAGIDHSNVHRSEGDPDDWVLLLPKDPDRSAERIRKTIQKKTRKKIGVVIIDSHGRAWREGVVGISIGVAYVPALVDLRGRPDLYGYRLRITKVAAVDELAAAASLLMGQSAEATPIIHVRGFPYALRAAGLKELIRPKETDLFR